MVGFYADKAMTTKISDTRDVDGDTVHEKIKVKSGDTLYIMDDDGRRFRIDVGDKPSDHWINLDITRVE
jgi:hypothetical protein